jgi:hypothetical protein
MHFSIAMARPVPFWLVSRHHVSPEIRLRKRSHRALPQGNIERRDQKNPKI